MHGFLVGHSVIAYRHRSEIYAQAPPITTFAVYRLISEISVTSGVFGVSRLLTDCRLLTAGSIDLYYGLHSSVQSLISATVANTARVQT